MTRIRKRGNRGNRVKEWKKKLYKFEPKKIERKMIER